MMDFPDVIPQDTPIQRACIRDMTTEQIEQLIDHMRERRMRAYTAYQEAQRMKAEAKSQKDAAMMQKRLVQLEKVFKTIDNGLDKANKYIAEVKVLALTAD